ncbi:MAG: UvrD-helicase domain-containing protein, partial [Treponema sp.]|nr:UvrD-helicase domain-containing protein [Treponema sp.]
LALKALCEQEDLRLQEQKAYQAIMIDEFQDNNNKNRDLLFILNEQDENGNNKGKLFFVGDEKQSIYKFRGADVSVFKQLAKDLNVEPIQMVYNYRSSKNLLKAFNQIFGGYVESACTEAGGSESGRTESNKNGSLKKILQRDRINDSVPQYWVFPENPAEDFEAAFAENNAALKNPALEEDNDRKKAAEKYFIPLHFCIYNSNVEPILKRLKKDGIETESEKDAFISANDQEAYFIAHKILTLVGKTLPDGKRLQYKDIAILDRSRTNRKYLTRYLNRAGIQYTTDAQKNIFAEAPVNDIYNFLRLCVYPGDTLSFASFLRSPFVNLSEKSVEEIIARLNSDFTTELNISAAENKKYQAAIELQKEFTEFSLSHPLTQVITKLWYEYGYRYETMWNKTVSLYGEQYDLLFEIARQADENGYGLTWLVDQLSIEKDKETSALGDSSSIEDSDISYPMEERDAVKIMTIHKSKGLQFKVVFVLGCFKNPQTRPDLQQVFFDDEFGITVNLNGKKSNYFYFIQSEKERKKNMAEFLRLIYVGITRAEHEAYITGSFSEPKETKSKDKKSDEDKQSASENCLQRILKFYYPEITGDSEFARGKTIFAKDDEILPEFDYNSIEPVYKTKLIKSISAERKNNLNEKLEFISKVAGKYSEINENSIIKKEIIESRYISPSSLEKSDFSNTDEISADKIIFPELTSLLEQTSKKGFSANDFGTLAHAYLEAFANGITPENFFVPSNYKGQLTSIQLEKIAQTCRKMTEYFTGSACGSALKNSTWHKAEYKFLHSFNGKIIRGTMDLIIKNADGSYLIVDYKTDEKIIPE